MQIVMFDRQSIFIHGMKISLQQRIPGVSIQGAEYSGGQSGRRVMAKAGKLP